MQFTTIRLTLHCSIRAEKRSGNGDGRKNKDRPALATLGDTYLAMGQAAGIAPELLHRVTAVATGGLDALPHNGAVITLLSICGLTHRQAYLDIAVVAVVIPILSLVLLIALGTLVGSF